MQKKIIALAIAGLMSGAAFAQSNVTISGLARMSVEQYKASSNTAGTNQSYNYNAVSDQSSMLVFSVREDLGGGSYAGVNIDNRWGGDMGGFAASGNTNVHVGGNWGRIALGRQDLHYGTAIEGYKAYTLQNILSSGPFAQVNGNTVAVGSRTPNVVMYDSPSMSGFNVRLAMSSAFRATEGTGNRLVNAVDPSQGSATNLELKYANGPIKAGYSNWRGTTEGGKGATLATADQRGDTVQFGYTMPMGLALGLGWNKSTLSTTAGDVGRTAWIIPVSYTFGASQVAFTYAKMNDSSGGFLASNANTGATAYTLAYGYSMSKRTNVGVAYTKLDNRSAATYDLFGLGANGAPSTLASTGAGSDVTQMSVNLNHAF